ncbi:MAG: TonB-dependent receptor [Saprospiraceae bacterium]
MKNDGMKRLVNRLVLLICLFPWHVGAQPPAGSRADIALAEGKGGLMGVVLDQQTEEPILLANVLVFEEGTQQLLTGTTTDERGFFRITDIAYGKYDIAVSYLGYDDWVKTGIALTDEERLARIGRVMLSSGSNTLAEIEVTAERAAIEFGLDRKVFNVERDIASSGGTAEDLLRNIPSVTVDLDGNISLRGSSNVRILINGKPSALTGMNRQGLLQQIAAGTIERIEVLTNPSAKYDPEGMGGIINIITKQQNKQGFNLQTSVNVGTNDKYNGNLNLNYRVGKFNLQGGYSYNYDNRFFRGERLRTTETVDTFWRLDQFSDGDRLRKSHTLQAGVEYFVSPRANLTLSGRISDQEGGGFSVRSNRFLDRENILFLSSERTEDEVSFDDSWEVNVDYRQRFRQEGRELTVSAQHTISDEEEEENYVEDFFYPGQVFFDTDRQINPALEDNDVWIFQTDYVHPVNDKVTLETGSRVTLRGIAIDSRLLDYNPATDDFEFIDSLSNLFDYQEDVYAVYGILKGSTGKWGWQLGARAEQTNTTSRLLAPRQETFENDYFSVFPSAFLTYKLNDLAGIQVNVSRRINRPNFRSLNPFIDQSDPLNPRTGNPFLRPEFINSYELNYLWSKEKGSLTIGAYFREISDMITRIIQPDETGTVNLRTVANLNSGRNYGLEAIVSLRPVEKLQIVLNGNAYRSEIDGNNLETDLNASGYQFSGRLQGNYTLGKDWGIQMTGFYRSRGVQAQGDMRPMYSIDMGIRKPILKDKASITLRATDIFNTRRFGFVSTSGGIIDDATFQRESRIVFLGFNYSLRQDKRKGRDKNDRREGGGMDDMDF